MKNPNFVWKKTHEINQERFSELLSLAKGKYRSMRTFAAECGADPSTFTRITKGAIKRACAFELLEKIATHADPMSGVTIQMLADANGYSVQEAAPQNTIKVQTARQYMSRERITRDIIFETLLKGKNSFQILPNQAFLLETKILKPDIVIKTNAFGIQDETWVIECLVGYNPSLENKQLPSTWEFVEIGNRLGRAALMMLEIEKHNSDPIRFSIVVYSKEAYERAIDAYREWPLPSNVSIILVDEDNGTIVDEFIFLHGEADRQKSILVTETEGAQGL